MKQAGTRKYDSFGYSVEILTFIIEDDEDPDFFLQRIKDMYPGAEIRIPRVKTAEVVFTKKTDYTPPPREEIVKEDDIYNDEFIAKKKQKKKIR